MSDGIARFKDFTGSEEQIKFSVRGETFTALDDIPLTYLGKLAELGTDISDGTKDSAANNVLKVFQALLEPESYERFVKAVNGESETVIGISRVKEIISWLLEQYGLRPTQPSFGSGDILSENGGSLTAGAPHAELILDPSMPAEVSTSHNTG